LDGFKGIGKRNFLKLRWILRKEATDRFMRDPSKRIVSVRIPHTEEIVSTGNEYAIGLAIGFVLIGIEHHSELADHSLESSVGGQEADLLSCLKFCLRDLKHRGTQVGGGKFAVRRQIIAKAAANDTGACRGLKNPARTQGSGATGDVFSIVNKDQ